MQNKKQRFIVCVNNKGYPSSLELYKIYQAIEDPEVEKDGDIRVIDESGEDYIYPANYFIEINLPMVLKQQMAKTVNL